MASADLEAEKTVVMISTDGSGCSPAPAAGPTADNTSAYATPNACVEYVIAVTNNGSVDATDVDISDALPSDVTYVDATAVNFTGGTVAESSGTVTLTGATLDAPSGAATDNVGYLIIRATIN